MESWLIRKDPDAGKDYGHLMQRADSLEKTLMLGQTEGRRRRGWRRMRQLDGITDSMDMSLSKLWEMLKDRESVLQSIGSQESDMTERLNNSPYDEKNIFLFLLILEGVVLLRH